MEASKQKLIELLKTQMRLEKKAAKACADKGKMVDNPIAKSLLYEIQLDSLKHAKLLQSLADVLQKAPPDLWRYRIRRYADCLAAGKALEEHAAIEQAMVKYTEDALKQVDDDGARIILHHILEDEKRHRQALRTTIERCFMIGPK